MDNFANAFSTTLGGAVDNATTSIPVASVAGAPACPFRALIDGELVIATSLSALTYTVTRGAESSGATAHSSGAAFTHIVTAAELNAFLGGPSSATAGHLAVFADTSGRLLEDGGAVPSGGGAAMTLIQSIVVGSGGAASVTFSSIPQTYLDLRLVANCRGDTAGSYNIQAQFNGDSGSNYDDVVAWNTGSGWSQNDNTGVSSARAGMCPPPTSNNGAAVNDLVIPNYAGTVFAKSLRWTASWWSGSGAPEMDTGCGVWQSAAAITGIVLKAAGGNFVAGSTFNLYGLG